MLIFKEALSSLKPLPPSLSLQSDATIGKLLKEYKEKLQSLKGSLHTLSSNYSMYPDCHNYPISTIYCTCTTGLSLSPLSQGV